MMVNPQRGEVALRADGETYVLRLSLGALASLEAAIEPDGLIDLAERIERGGVRMQDVIAILAAGFCGAGRPVERGFVEAMVVDGGAAEATRVAVSLVVSAFSADAP